MTNAKYTGALTIEPPLNKDEVKALSAFFLSRRILTHGGPLDCRQLPGYHPVEVIDIAAQPEGQPGEWCDLEVSDDGTALSWNGSDHTGRDLHEWIIYLINYLLKPGAEYDIRERGFDLSQMSDDNLLRSFTFNHQVDGEITGTAVEADGVWRITVKENVVSTAPVVLELASTDADEDV
jgi:hypothetical protein